MKKFYVSPNIAIQLDDISVVVVDHDSDEPYADVYFISDPENPIEIYNDDVKNLLSFLNNI